MRQDDTIVARTTIDMEGLGRVGPDRLRAIAVSEDAQRVWPVVETPGIDEAMVRRVADDCVYLEGL